MRVPLFYSRMIGWAGAAAYYRYMSTLDARYWSADPSMDPKSEASCQPLLYAFWHEYILLPVAFFGNCRVATITSKHRDAEIVSHLAEFMGFKIFRGSTNHGGTEALRQMLSIGKAGYHLTLMPDGPQGPRRQMTLGTLFMASRLGVPIVPTGMGFYRPWRMNSWDRFAIPKPFSRARLIFPEKIQVPKLKMSELEDYRVMLEEKLRTVTGEAEEWACSGTIREGEKVLDHRPMLPDNWKETVGGSGF
ncbi:MAG: lysophospholipid acyltransferase family protein [Planctomycetia bacterium]|nr:lysophospholipid acyltransferase family protein [Planctomycetia bacterium]